MSEGWLVGKWECRMCGHIQISVYPNDIMDDTRGECENCGHMTAEVIANLCKDGRMRDE